MPVPRLTEPGTTGPLWLHRLMAGAAREEGRAARLAATRGFGLGDAFNGRVQRNGLVYALMGGMPGTPAADAVRQAYDRAQRRGDAFIITGTGRYGAFPADAVQTAGDVEQLLFWGQGGYAPDEPEGWFGLIPEGAEPVVLYPGTPSPYTQGTRPGPARQLP